MMLKEGRIDVMGKTQEIITTAHLSEYFSHDIEISQHEDRYVAKLKTETKIAELF